MTLNAVWEAGETPATGPELLLPFIGAARTIAGYRATFHTFWYEGDLARVIASGGDATVVFRGEGPFRVARVTRRRGRNTPPQEGFLGILVLADYPNMVCVYTECPATEKGVLPPVVRSARPQLVAPFVSAGELCSAVARTARNRDEQVIVVRSVARPRGENSDVSYRARPLHLAIEEAQEIDATIHRAEFVVEAANRERRLHACLSRDLEARYQGGDPKRFTDDVLRSSWALAAACFRKLHRSPGRSAEPVSIRFSLPTFRAATDNRELVAVLGRVTAANIAVYHANPYLHGCFMDYYDGSSCEVVVCDENTVRLIPGARCSLFALMRLCDTIVSRFGDAQISETRAGAGSVERFLARTVPM